MKEKCPFCNKDIEPSNNFCPNCGKQIPEGNVDFPSGQKVKIYILSALLAPLGLYWFFKYFKNENPNKRRVAYTALYITVVMIIILVTLNFYFVKALESYMGTYNLESFGL